MTPSRITLLVALTLQVGCHKETPVPQASVTRAPAVVPQEPAPPPPVVVEQIVENFQRVLFATDSSVLGIRARTALDANALLLTQNPAVNVQVQGFCDERGTVDYNLALGGRRARAIEGYLHQQGVDGSQVAVISYGEQRPRALAHDEAAWSQNRRGEFAVTDGGKNGLVRGSDHTASP